MSTEATIKNFIIDNLLSGSDRTNVESDEPLVNSGIVDSLGMLRLITFIEEQFDLEVGDADVGDENFETLSRLATFVDRKLAES